MVGRDLPDQVRFHIHLSMLGKTARDKEEMKLLTGVDGFGSDIGGWESLYAWSRWRDIPVPVPNKVFLFEVSQPFDKDERRRDLFRKDIGDYIGLTKPLEPLKVAASSKNLHYAIDICDQKFADLRVELMRISVSASTWIRKYFMNLPDVVVSSPDRFEEILMTWLEDPCEAQR